MLKYGLLFFICSFLISCSGEDKGIKDSMSGFQLKESKFSQLEDWKKDDLFLFDKAINSVCSVIEKNNDDKLKSEKFEVSLKEYKKHCKTIKGLKDRDDLKEYIEDNFKPYLVMNDGEFEGKFTSYYEAEIRASFKKSKKYKYPIYGKPYDLVEVNLRDFDENLPNQRLLGRVKDGKLIKYYTRKEIDEGLLDAPVILWGDNLVDIYLMQIQGAAVANLPSGKKIRVGYQDNNGHKFRGIGSILLEKGLIEPKDASMDKIREWLEDNDNVAKKNMLLNDRFIFHKIVDAEGPIGAMGIPLYEGRSMAVDKEFIPLGVMLWVETNSPEGKLNKLVMAEDVGSAIKGAVRGDYFWGHGQEALKYAGRMNASGKYYMLLPKNAKVKIYD
ncbi:MAG: MltA domain-containing protein [Alphaproteobacteria bacterium]|nr:MltA domain-containing protein [Alphaproteobacteria bacterium]